MSKIFSSAALRNKQREVKDEAMKDLVYITENGNGAFVFCSEEVLEKLIEKEREDALYEARLHDAFDRSEKAISEGKYYTSVADARKYCEDQR